MSDRFTEVTTQGYGQRLGGSLAGALFGLILVPGAIALLYWNEGRAVTAATALRRGAQAVVEVNEAQPDPTANGKLVHATGQMRAATPAADPSFGVTAPGLLRLTRNVDMFQWREQSSSRSEESVGGSKTTETTYSYSTDWSARPLDSGHFKMPANHQNPPMPVESASFSGSGVTLGAYQVDPSLLEKVSAFSTLAPTTAPPPDYRAAGDHWYRGQDPAHPAVGDLRVSFAAVPAQIISVAAAQAGTTLTTYRDSSGYSIALAEPGAVTAAALFQDAAKQAATLTWILRGAGFVAMLLGFVCLASPLTTLFAVLPLLESLAGAGAFLAALTLAVPLTLLTIGIAWVAHRPLLGGTLLAAGLAAPFVLRLTHQRRAPA